jgi:copper chaperone NosL
MDKLSNSARWLIVLGSLSLVVCFYVPVWAIYLFAPQYPEGLMMNIWLNKITGDVEIINGLNHYIGMKHINADMFPEFSFLIYIVAFYMLLGLVVAWTRSVQWLFWYLVFTAFGGVFALFDFYRWGYEYGHNLNEDAAIKVPGLSYQPPVLGHKRLLNFDAYSYPDIGAWVVIVVVMIFAIIWLMHRKDLLQKIGLSKTLIILIMSFFFFKCTVEPKIIIPGKENCQACKMTIMDIRYAAQVITSKGKIFLYDDIGCLAASIKSHQIEENECKKILVSDYTNPMIWLDARLAIFIKAAEIHSPMNYNFAAFDNKASVESAVSPTERKSFSWVQVKEMLNE